jgi:hypothetical protein
MTFWRVINEAGKGLTQGVRAASDAIQTAADTIQRAPDDLRQTMAITEITAVFNTTDTTITFINRENARDTRRVPGQSTASLANEQIDAAWVPWYEPPRFADFANRHIAILVAEEPVMVLWQRGGFVFWSDALNADGSPRHSYKLGGANHIGGKRILVIRYDPRTGYSGFLTPAT